MRTRTAFVDSDEWQLGEIRKGIEDLDENRTVSHDVVSKWLNNWGTANESKVSE